jgi:hypothetical protein
VIPWNRDVISWNRDVILWNHVVILVLSCRSDGFITAGKSLYTGACGKIISTFLGQLNNNM